MKSITKKYSLGLITAAAFSLSACSGEAEESGSAATETTAFAPGEAVGMFAQACGADVVQYCSDVMPGDGRIQSCLYAHQDLISDTCFAATEQTGVMLERLFDRYSGLYEACSVDLERGCADVEFGGGAQLACLRENEADISQECSAELPGITALSNEDD